MTFAAVNLKYPKPLIASVGFVGFIASLLLNYWYSFELALYSMTIFMLLFYIRIRIKEVLQWLNREESLIWFRAVLILLIAIAAGLRLYLVFISDNAVHPDGSCRLLISHLAFDYYLPDRNFLYALNPNPDWPPLHFYLNSGLLSLGFETTGIRFFHAFIGAWSGFLLYRIAREISSVEVAFVVALGYLLYPASFIMSSQVVTEPLFLFTTLQSFRSLQVFYKNRKATNLNRLIIWLFVGTLLRYEGWLLPGSFIILYLIFFRPFSTKELLKLFIPFLGPVLISTMLVLQGHHALRGILYSDFQVAYCFDYAGRTLKVFFDGYKEGWIPLSSFGLVICAFLFRRSRKTMLFVSFAILFATPFIIKNATFGIFPQYRYMTYYMAVFLIPLVIVLWHFISKGIGRTPISLIILSCVTVGLSTFGLWFKGLGTPRFPQGFHQSVEFVKQIPKGHFILDHHYGVNSYNWISETSLPLAIEYYDGYLYNQASIHFESINRVCNDSVGCKKSIKFIVTDYDSEFDQINVQVLDSIISHSSDNYLVLFEDRPLDRHFAFREKHEYYHDEEFEKIFEENGYRVYRQNFTNKPKP